MASQRRFNTLSNSIDANTIVVFDPTKDPKIAEHRQRLNKIIGRFFRPVREGPPIKVRKLGFSYTLQQGDFDEMEEKISQGLKEMDWRDVEELDKFVAELYAK